MKRSELFFDAILVPVDFLAIVMASVGTYGIRISPLLQTLRPALFTVDLPLREFVVLVSVVAGLTLPAFAALGLYSMRVTRRLVDEFTRIAAGATLSAMGIILWMFLRSDIFESRFILVGAWVSSIILVTLLRYSIRTIQLRLLERGIGTHRTVLVGDTSVTHQIAKELETHRRLGYRIAGRVPRGDRAALETIYRNGGIDEIIQCDPSLSETENFLLLDFCEDRKVEYKYIPNLYSTRVSNVAVRTLAGYPLVELRHTPLDGWGRVAKRVVDLVGAAGGLTLLAPFFTIIAALIVWDSRGPIFFRQVRIGRHQRPFRIVKFRTMVPDAEERKRDLLTQNEREGPLFKIRDDPRVTRVGRYLRRYRIDELPQLWNVLRNSMSLIGPRPHLPTEISQYRKEHRKLFTVKPGVTGFAQVSGSSDLSFEQEATLDLQYIEQWSLKLDLQILLRTVWKLLWDRSAV